MNPTELMALMQQDPTKAQQLMESVLAERAATDPTLAMLMQLMTNRSHQSADDDAAPSSPASRAAEQIQDLKAALANAYELLDDLAAGLGACAACWGDDETCAGCRGRGRSGWRRPEDDRFQALIAPAVARRAVVSTAINTKSPATTTLDHREGNDE